MKDDARSTGRDPEASPSRVWPEWCRSVVFVAPRYPEVSGGSRFIDNLGEALTARGIHVSVISIYPGSSTTALDTTTIIEREELHRRSVVRGAGSPLARLRGLPLLVFKKWDALRFRRRFRRLMTALGPETVVIFTHAIAKLALDDSGFLSSSSPALFVGQHHSAFESLSHEPSLREQIVRAFHDVDVFTALSADDAAMFSEILRAPCFGIANIAAPVHRTPLRSEPRRPVAVGLVRLTAEKQVDVMIRAFVRATSGPDLNDWRLDVYGDGYERPSLERLIESLDGAERVHLRGTTDEPARVLQEAAINLLTSRYEGFGYSVLEAAQAATPSIAFDCSTGLRQLMTTVDGRLVPAEGGEAAYADALRQMLSDPVSLAERGTRAHEGARAYAPENVLAEWAIVLDAAHDARVAEDARGRSGADPV